MLHSSSQKNPLTTKQKTPTLMYQGHPFHLVTPSYCPLLGAISGFLLTLGTALYMHGYAQAAEILIVGLLLLFFTMFQWWRDVVNESIQGYHTTYVQTGLKYGMILFIASEVMFFFAFFWAFFHSSLAPTVEIGCSWAPLGIDIFHPFDIPLVNTMLLLLSGVAVTWSHDAMIEGYSSEATSGLVVTILLAVIFTVFQGYEYVTAPFNISDSVYGSTFYITTGLHGLHVIVGTILLIVCLIRHQLGHFTPTHHIGFEASIWYWHFVDVVWLFLYVFVYYWGSL